MKDDPTLPEADRVEGAPHPRETPHMIGQQAAERAFLEAYGAERLHHGWLLTGPQGLGKATLAWRIARFLLATPPAGDDGMFGAPPPPATLDIAADHPVMRRTQALSEPGLFLLRRVWDADKKRLKTQLTVEEVRKLRNFFSLSATDGGRRVVIVDSADEMNPSAANAILKLLEEPPARTTLLLISHQPSRLLPTIRSRCRELRLAPLMPADMAAALAATGAEVAPHQTEALAALSAGSVGAAIRLLNLDGLKLYAELVALLGTLPDLDRPRAIALAETAAARGREDRLDLLFVLLDLALARLARTGVTGAAPLPEAAQGEAAILTRLSRSLDAGRAWATLAQTAGDRARHGRAVNIDPAALVLDSLLHLRDTAATFAR
ncbi:DNA polymerase III subunit delta' [Puniceibacterium sp. IMCC21224]|uniref:DNA polymerase III subunit delta' n=1 Tax=Puniceibacterium sp. IMCC21224 TaxID=1618204 RepID=UPI00064E048D|nr:DNA polymerase III subunit delta' [Puniceibacterium sp. IMCC21224]KMK67742.1 DNA polymerase III, delta prime subunit [Puniceibacterium sp. IMCC21224]